VPLRDGPTVIGRGAEADLAIVGPLVSRRHARIVNQQGQVVLEDLGSANGVFVNGMPVKASAELKDGDSILIGTLEITLFFGEPDAEAVSSRRTFDDQGNLLACEEIEERQESTTQIRMEPAEDDDGEVTMPEPEERTAQGTRPPESRFASRSPQPSTQRPDPDNMPKSLPRVTSPPRLSAGPATEASPALTVPAPSSGPPSSGRSQPSAPPVARMSQPVAKVTLRSLSASRDPLEVVVDVVDRMVERGDLDAAGRALEGQLQRRMEAMRGGAPVPDDALAAAGLSCLDLAEASRDAHWLNLVIETYLVARRPMAEPVATRVAGLIGEFPAANRDLLMGYKDLVRSLLGTVDPEDLFACECVLAIDSE
jgi:pSer/pThr/pTyr-binding forkhead associated (FHA) protein